jgi:putative phosphoesterase
MKRIGILSDTHGYVHPRVEAFFSGLDEIWHAGDIGDIAVIHRLRAICPVRAVYGNIDGRETWNEFGDTLIFDAELVKVYMTHIGGYPGKYDPRSRAVIMRERPGLFVCGHSHILKVMYDKDFNLLHINPGSAGKYGIHKSITAVRLIIDGANMRDLEILDLPR